MTDKELCPVCRHDVHTSAGCPDCKCTFERVEKTTPEGVAITTRRKATQAWQHKVPDHDTPEYEALNAKFYSTKASGGGLKSALEDYTIDLKTGAIIATWGQAFLMKIQLRWGMKLQLLNTKSFIKMINYMYQVAAMQAVRIYEEENPRPPYPSMTQIFIAAGADPNNSQDPVGRAAYKVAYEEWERACVPWNRARDRIATEIGNRGPAVQHRNDQTGDYE